jgi:hypothetical protein
MLGLFLSAIIFMINQHRATGTNMNSVDYAIVAIYLIGLLLRGLSFVSDHQNKNTFYLVVRLAGNLSLCLSWLLHRQPLALFRYPLFVGLRKVGGLVWLSFELASPLDRQ